MIKYLLTVLPWTLEHYNMLFSVFLHLTIGLIEKIVNKLQIDVDNC